mgnify:FL=1
MPYVKDSHFPVRIFFIILGSLLLVGAFHLQIIVLYDKHEGSLNGILEVTFVILYWILVSLFITEYITVQIKKTYEEPMKRIAEATGKVAKGDFSVYLPPIHSADKMDYLDAVAKAVRRLSNLITNMLKLNKLESQKIKPAPESYDLCRQLGECAISFEQIWDQKNIEFEADFEDEALIYADHELMDLVWSNLLSNAFKFTEPGGTVSVTQISDRDFVTVAVSDTGCGMSKATMEHIFDKFYQGDSSHATEGNGLGLALVLRILQIAGASITVDSKEGVGTIFTVKIPVTTEAERNERNE